MRRNYPAMWKTADQYVRAINGSKVSIVIATLPEMTAMHDPFQDPSRVGGSRHMRASDVSWFLKMNGF